MFRRFKGFQRSALVAVLAAAAGFVPAVAAAAAPEAAPSLVVNVSSTEDPAYPMGSQLAFDSSTDATVLTRTATTSSVEFRIYRPSIGESINFDLLAEPGHPLHTGSFVSDGYLSAPAVGLSISTGQSDQGPSSDGGVPTTWVIRDIAADASGTLTRLDVVFRFDPDRAVDGFFGQLRYGEPHAEDHVDSATVLDYPLAPVGSPPIRADEVIDNTSTSPLAVSAAGISGPDADQFAILTDGCASGGWLAPGKGCPISVAYRPTRAGEHTALLQLRIAGRTEAIDLAGVSPYGYTGITTSGNDFVDGGQTHSQAEGDTQWTLKGSAHVFHADAVSLTHRQRGDLYTVTFNAPTGELPTLGSHPYTDPFATDSYGLGVSRGGTGCDSQRGTLNIKRMDLAPDGLTPVVMDIAFVGTCTPGSSGAAPIMKGEFLWRAPITTSIAATAPAVTYGHTATVGGTAPAGAAVTMFVHKLPTAGYAPAGTVTAGVDGRWSYRYPATTDERLYGQVTGVATASTLIQVTPTLSGAAARVVPRAKTYTLTGTGAVGSAVRLHFHRLGMAANDYSILRDVAVSAGGRWSCSYVADTDYRVYVTSRSSGRSSAKFLLQAR